MELLYFFENIRNPFLDGFFFASTALGAEVFFIILAITVYWCFNKKLGYYLMSVCFAGAVINQILKLVTRIPRPWVLDPDFSIVEAARSSAPGYSFPSGHTQNAVSVAGCLFLSVKDHTNSKIKIAVLRIICVVCAFVVAISRMYLGVHTSWDVLISALLALVLVFVFRVLFFGYEKNPKMMYFIIAGLFVASSAYLILSYTAKDISAHDLENILSSKRHAWYMVGGVLGIAVAYPLEKRFVNFETKASLPLQIFKLLPGAVAVFGLKMLEEPLLFVFGGNYIAHGIRYFLIVVFAICVWPAIFSKIIKAIKKPK